MSRDADPALGHDSDPALTWLDRQIRRRRRITDEIAAAIRRKYSIERLRELNHAKTMEARVVERRDEYVRRFNLTNGL